MMDPTLLHSNDAKVIKKSYRHGNKLDDLGAQVLTKYKKARDHGLEFFSELHRTEALLQEWREESERLEQESTPTSTKDTEVSDKPLQKDAEVQGQPSRDRKRTGNEDKRATKGSEGTS
ncbi:hypothetical protein BGZ83_002244 [Gryganskiella cystojenkinii]|nr:hypothetical protein BGZ83_002244 [Gryganskiella cystojenkinii]